MMTIDCKPCMFCRSGPYKITVDIEPEQYRRWLGGTPIQLAMPNLTADEREQLMTGSHPECWDNGFGDDD